MAVAPKFAAQKFVAGLPLSKPESAHTLEFCKYLFPVLPIIILEE
jgi:hypothetical protein